MYQSMAINRLALVMDHQSIIENGVTFYRVCYQFWMSIYNYYHQLISISHLWIILLSLKWGFGASNFGIDAYEYSDNILQWRFVDKTVILHVSNEISCCVHALQDAHTYFPCPVQCLLHRLSTQWRKGNGRDWKVNGNKYQSMVLVSFVTIDWSSIEQNQSIDCRRHQIVLIYRLTFWSILIDCIRLASGIRGSCLASIPFLFVSVESETPRLHSNWKQYAVLSFNPFTPKFKKYLLPTLKIRGMYTVSDCNENLAVQSFFVWLSYE